MAHLAGALGVPVWLALNNSPDWRWLLGRQDSPWYPTMRLFRQDIPGDWTGVFGNIAAALRRFGLPEGTPDRSLITEAPSTAVSTALEVSALVETSIGELVDKITILEIKSNHVTDISKLAQREAQPSRVARHLQHCLVRSSRHQKTWQLDELISQLKAGE